MHYLDKTKITKVTAKNMYKAKTNTPNRNKKKSGIKRQM